jgi:hypothetical protein
MKRTVTALLLVLSMSLGIGNLKAQDPNPNAGAPNQGAPNQGADGTYDLGADPGPNRGVARISLLNGDVSVRRGDSGDVVAAAVNAPLMVQDSLLTTSSSRAELQFDASNMLRVGANTEVRVANLNNGSYQLQLATGTVTLRVFRQDGQTEIDTPSVSVRPLRPGAYRITVREDGSSEITVREGEVEIASATGSQHVGPTQTMLVRGTPQEAEFQTVAATQIDGWDRWNLERDRLFQGSRSAQYVGPDVTGTEELDNNGRWVADPSYGQVWTPNTADPNWAPYRNGDWTWEDYYGWTWVSADPWGWAPYHYGRWFYGGSGWCWWPGPLYGRHYWAPAYVGFFGFGGGFGVGFGFGHVGWVALAPFERFHPWWGRGWGGHNIFENSRVINNVNIANNFRNARVSNGITGVAASQFGRRTGGFSSFNGSQIQSGGVVRGLPPIAPGRTSLAFNNRVASGNYPQSGNRQFFTRSSTPTPTASRSFGATGTPAGAHDWSRFGTPIRGGGTSPQQLSAPQPQQQSGGWRGFGNPAVQGGSGATARGWNSYESRPAAPGSSYGYSGSAQSVRINPPMVQQRAPNYAAPPSYHAPSPGYSAPSYRAPSYSAPSYNAPSYNNGGGASSGRSTPSYGGGGGGGGRAAPSGGGGGGGHASSSGGGGGHSSGGGGGHHR